MRPRVILDKEQFEFTIERLCHQLIEAHGDFSNTALIGVQPRGVFLSDRIVERLQNISPKNKGFYGKLDITFYRDDFRRRDSLATASQTTIDFSIEGKKVVLIDDVLFTGRTIRSAMDALLDFGRPDHVELLTLIDRRLSRDVPIQADYIGKKIDSIESERVKVEWKDDSTEDRVWILRTDKKD